jgi:divalent metal cation (Fe/Co/Zn/Cd) transporter
VIPKRREKTALRIIAISFFALAAYVTIESVRSLLGSGHAEHSTIGLVLAAVSLAVMPGLSYTQRRAGRELGSRTAVATLSKPCSAPTCPPSC